MRAAAARPAACMSERDGTPCSTAARSSSAACDALTTRTLIAMDSVDAALRGGRGVPGIIAVERVLEVEHAGEIVARVAGLAEQQAKIHQGEHDVPEVGGGCDAPVLEHHPREHTVPLPREIAARLGEF